MCNILARINALAICALLALPASGAVIYNNLTPNNSMAMATRPDSPGSFEIETGDDFVLGQSTSITSASFIGLIVPGLNGGSSISDVVVEMYLVFPQDSNTVRTPNVVTRANSPADVAFDSRDSTGGGLTFGTSILAASFSVLNSVQPGGIHPFPNQTTGGNGALTGQEVEFDVTFAVPFNLPANHYFFVPQVLVTNGGQFYWLSASRPISGAGTTPFAPDLQAWTRDSSLDPDWSRVGTDIVGGSTPPTFNAAFSLTGTAVPEPGTIFLGMACAGLLGLKQYTRRRS